MLSYGSKSLELFLIWIWNAEMILNVECVYYSCRNVLLEVIKGDGYLISCTDVKLTVIFFGGTPVEAKTLIIVI